MVGNVETDLLRDVDEMLVRILAVELLGVIFRGVDVSPVLAVDEQVQQAVAIEVDPDDFPTGTTALVDTDFPCDISIRRTSAARHE